MTQRGVAVAVAVLVTSAIGAAVARPAGAQAALSPSCAEQTLAQDVCQKAADVFSFMAPQLAASVAGGNATLGQGGNLGGVGRLSVGLRVTGLRGALPQVQDVSARLGPAQATTFPVDEQWIGLPQVDVGVGVFRGFPLALTNVGGIDVLASVAWLPNVTEPDLEVRAVDSRFRVGLGARVGLLQESPSVPGVAVTFLRRGLPTVNVTARTDNDTLSVLGAEVTSDSWRIVGSKNLFGFGLAGGFGQDRYRASAAVAGVVNEGGSRAVVGTPQPFRQTMTRSNAFANLSLNFFVVRLVGEIGRVWGGEATTFNRFDGAAPNDSRLYGSVGLRLGV